MSVFETPASRTAKFEQIGDQVFGRIFEIGEPYHAKKYKKDELDYWPSGDPVLNVKVSLETDQRDPEDQDDDGKRNLYFTVSGTEGGMLWAARKAIKLAGFQDMAIGGKLGIRLVGYDPESQNPQNPRKLYEAYYEGPPAGGGAFASPGQDQHVAQPPQQQQDQQATRQEPHPGFGGQQPTGNAAGPSPHFGAPAQQQQPAPQQQQLAPEFQTGGQPDFSSPMYNTGGQLPQQPAPAPQPAQGFAGAATLPPQQPRTANDYKQAAAAGPQPGGFPAPQPAAAAAPPQQVVNVDPAQIVALVQQGLTDQEIQSTTGASPEAIAGVRALFRPAGG